MTNLNKFLLVIVAGIVIFGLTTAYNNSRFSPVPRPIPSDVNEDGDVDLQDVSIVISHISTTTATSTATSTPE